MELLEIKDRNQWEDFVKSHPSGTFLQSWEFGELNKTLGDKPLYLGISRGDQILKGVALVIRVRAKRGDFLYIPYGPLLIDNDLFAFFVGKIREIAKAEKVAFVRVSPWMSDTPEHRELFKQNGFRPAPMHMLAEHLWLLDLRGKSSEQLFSGVEKKHRNLIRRAEKEGVSVHISTKDEDIEKFITLHEETFKRHNFHPYPLNYFRNQVKLFREHDEVIVFSAEKDGVLLASAVIMYYGNTASYHHGASTSDPELRKIPASYLLQWKAVEEALKRGCTTYNFWGIAPNENPKHPFYGITHFKTGFGGHRFDLLHCQDLPISKKYLLNFAVESFRKWKRGF